MGLACSRVSNEVVVPEPNNGAALVLVHQSSSVQMRPTRRNSLLRNPSTKSFRSVEALRKDDESFCGGRYMQQLEDDNGGARPKRSRPNLFLLNKRGSSRTMLSLEAALQSNMSALGSIDYDVQKPGNRSTITTTSSPGVPSPTRRSKQSVPPLLSPVRLHRSDSSRSIGSGASTSMRIHCSDPTRSIGSASTSMRKRQVSEGAAPTRRGLRKQPSERSLKGGSMRDLMLEYNNEGSNRSLISSPQRQTKVGATDTRKQLIQQSQERAMKRRSATSRAVEAAARHTQTPRQSPRKSASRQSVASRLGDHMSIPDLGYRPSSPQKSFNRRSASGRFVSDDTSMGSFTEGSSRSLRQSIQASSLPPQTSENPTSPLRKQSSDRFLKRFLQSHRYISERCVGDGATTVASSKHSSPSKVHRSFTSLNSFMDEFDKVSGNDPKKAYKQMSGATPSLVGC